MPDGEFLIQLPQVLAPGVKHEGAVRGNPKNFAIELLILLEVVPHGTQFLTSRTGKGERHEEQQQLIACKGRESDFVHRIGPHGELRCRLSYW